MSKIMFGDNFEKDCEMIVYHTMKGQASKITVKEFYEHILTDSVYPSTQIFYLFIDILSKLPWSPQSYCRQNFMNAYAAILTYAETHLIDQNCVLAILLKNNPENKFWIVSDLMGFLIGASDTTPSALS